MKTLLWVLLLCGTASLSAQTNIQIGEPAPEIVVTHWLKNEPRNKNFKNKFIVLDFWATWCKPCLEAIPHINELRRKFPRKDLLFLMTTSEPPQLARSVFDRIDFQVPVVCDVSKQTEINFGNGTSGLASWPTTVLIDKQNIVRWIGRPENLTGEMMDHFLNKAVSVALISNQFRIERPARKESERWTFRDHEVHPRDTTFPAYVYVAEVDDPPEKGTDIKALWSAGTSAYFSAGTLREYFSSLHTEMVLELPTSLEGRLFTISWSNEQPSKSANLAIIKEIVAGAGCEVTFSKTEVLQHTVTLVNEDKLVPTESTERWSGCDDDNFGSVLCERITISGLIDVLNQRTDDVWIYRGGGRKRYDFELFLNSPETIRGTLKDYGLRIKSKPITVDVATVKVK